MATAPRKNEFERIAAYFAPLAEGYPGAFGLLDDAALIAPGAGEDLVVTTDTVVSGIHFMGDEPAALVARKLLRVNLSDLAAMGAVPRAYTLNIALPSSTGDDWLEEFVAGLKADQDTYSLHLIGGDSVSTSGPITLTVTAFGIVRKGEVLRRSGARPGDHVYVSGTIGDATLGLALLQGRAEATTEIHRAYLVDRYRLPRPRVALGHRLGGVAHAAADVSDGLIADLGHIADTSKVAITVESASVPLSPAAAAMIDERRDLLETVLMGGDDYELVFAVPAAFELGRTTRESGTELARIGTVSEGEGVVVLDAAGRPMEIATGGFRHA